MLNYCSRRFLYLCYAGNGEVVIHVFIVSVYWRSVASALPVVA